MRPMDPSTPVRYFDRDFRVEAVRILPGQYHASRGPGTISTVLGSCVATCLWDPVGRIGGMNHFMLPGESGSAGSPWGLTARFGVYAMEVLINEMLHQGADRRRLVAKAFSGARVLGGDGVLDVGARNSEFVLEFLREEGIRLLAQDLLGVAPRKIHFFPETGRVQLKKLHLHKNDPVRRSEREYYTRIAGDSAGGDVEIFAPPR